MLIFFNSICFIEIYNFLKLFLDQVGWNAYGGKIGRTCWFVFYTVLKMFVNVVVLATIIVFIKFTCKLVIYLEFC